MRVRASLVGTIAIVAIGALCFADDKTGAIRADVAPPSDDDLARGQEIFLREWLPKDARSHGGDGLGPVYNETSCVGCHNLGGTGGAGPGNKDVSILTAFNTTNEAETVRGDTLRRRPLSPEDQKREAEAELVRLHSGFISSRSVVVHRYSTDPSYNAWRRELLLGGKLLLFRHRRLPFTGGPDFGSITEMLRFQSDVAARTDSEVAATVTGFQLVLSRRNVPPLFGLGKVDAIPAAVLEEAAAKTHPSFPTVKGHVSRLEGGAIGRFGWKAQIPSLKELVLNACAIELGLNVPGHPQAEPPRALTQKQSGLDLNDADCAALTAFVRRLPNPVERAAANAREAETLRQGQETFGAIGCATCHVPELGDVEGIYSDLLLHDMGTPLSDSGSSYGLRTRRDEDNSPQAGAGRKEWRTPPLWGFRDSAPYLHDGRAENLDEVVAFHEGQAGPTARLYFALSDDKRRMVEAFLKSLTAPAR